MGGIALEVTVSEGKPLSGLQRQARHSFLFSFLLVEPQEEMAQMFPLQTLNAGEPCSSSELGTGRSKLVPECSYYCDMSHKILAFNF